MQVGEDPSEVCGEVGERRPLPGVRAREVEAVARAVDELAEDREVRRARRRRVRHVARAGRVVLRVPAHLEPCERSRDARPPLRGERARDGQVRVGPDRDGPQDLEHRPAGDPGEQHRAVRLLDAQSAPAREVDGVGARCSGGRGRAPLGHGQERRPARRVRGAVVHEPGRPGGRAAPGVVHRPERGGGARPPARRAWRGARRVRGARGTRRRVDRLEDERHLHDEVDAVPEQPQQVEDDARGPRRVRRRRDVERERQPRHVLHLDALDGVPPALRQPRVEERHELRGGKVRPSERHAGLLGLVVGRSCRAGTIRPRGARSRRPSGGRALGTPDDEPVEVARAPRHDDAPVVPDRREARAAEHVGERRARVPRQVHRRGPGGRGEVRYAQDGLRGRAPQEREDRLVVALERHEVSVPNALWRRRTLSMPCTQCSRDVDCSSCASTFT